jgi:LemA protein
MIALALISLRMILQVYNRIVFLDNRINNSKSQIDIELKKRYDLIPDLIKLVESYKGYEKNIITEIAFLRKDYIKHDPKNSRRILMLQENYPQLKSNVNFKNLMEQLSKIENNIAYYRGFCSKTILKYNTLISTIPFNIVAKITGFKEQEYVKF